MESSTATEAVASSATSCESVSRSNWWEDCCANGSGKQDADNNYGNAGLQGLARALSEAASLASQSKKKNRSRHPKAVANGLPVKPSIRAKDACMPGRIALYLK